LRHESPVDTQHRLDLIRGQHEQPTDDVPRRPPEPPRDLVCRALIPADLAFDGTQVVELGLDLDDKERCRARVECKEIDPAMRPTMDDLDLAGRSPAALSEPAVVVG
jgi:hypothetical protein